MRSAFHRNDLLWVLLLLSVAFTRGALAEKAQGVEAGKESDWRVYWDDGLFIKTKDNNFDLKIGGRLMLDGAVIDPDDKTEVAFPDLSGTLGRVRRARIYLLGTIYQNYEYKFQLDFYQLPELLYKDVYIGMKNIPYVGNIRVGHQFEPFSLEEDTSTKYITFMERALPTLAFYPDRNAGVILYNAPLNKRLFWGVGAFKPVEDDEPFDFGGNSGWNASARITGLPWFEDQTRLLHLGLSYIHKFRSESTEEDKRLQFKTQPEFRFTENLVDTGKLISDGADMIDAELALVLGPFSLQGEYFDARVDRDRVGNLDFSGFYAFASYFITGESRHYDASKAAFASVDPKKNFHMRGGGLGAWEVALRYSYIDLNDEDIQGGEEKNWTIGLNWYLNPNARLMFNYVFANVKNSDAGARFLEDGDANIFAMRFQLAF